jgi:hypothetical protein
VVRGGAGDVNDAQYAAYSTYIRDLADRLLLRDWEITLRRNETRGENYAAVFIFNTENHAVVKLDEDYWGGSREDQREWLVHELLHCHLDRPDRVMEQLAEQWSENSACQFAKEAHHREIEVCVQRFARLLAPLMPLPPKVKGTL